LQSLTISHRGTSQVHQAYHTRPDCTFERPRCSGCCCQVPITSLYTWCVYGFLLIPNTLLNFARCPCTHHVGILCRPFRGTYFQSSNRPHIICPCTTRSVELLNPHGKFILPVIRGFLFICHGNTPWITSRSCSDQHPSCNSECHQYHQPPQTPCWHPSLDHVS
jgi:hypothetical protein